MIHKETFKNKIAAIALLFAGLVPVMIDGDATFLVLAGCFAVPLFLAKENWIF